MPQRRLAAILSADVVGFSRLMAMDEAGTLATLKKHRTSLFDPEMERHGGRIVKIMGDGVLVEFSSVVDAVEAAIAVQRDLARQKSAIQLRIGINLGDVIVDGDDIYGDGVNVASRLEAMAPSGGICVSGIVHQSVGNRVEAAFADTGEHDLKNIEQPVRVFQWQGEAQPTPEAAATPPVRTVGTKVRAGGKRNLALVGGIAAGVGIVVLGAMMLSAGPETPSPVSAEQTAAGIAPSAADDVPGSAADTGDTATVPEPDAGGAVETASADPGAGSAETAPTETAPTAPAKVPANELRALLAGKTVRGGKDFGGRTFTLKLDASGQFRGEIGFGDSIGSSGLDTGKWGVRDGQFCFRFTVIAGAEETCSTVLQAGESYVFHAPDGEKRGWALSP